MQGLNHALILTRIFVPDALDSSMKFLARDGVLWFGEFLSRAKIKYR